MTTRSGHASKLAALVFAACLCAYFATAGGHLYSIDEICVAAIADSLSDGNGFAFKQDILDATLIRIPTLAIKGSDGRYYSKYAPLNSVLLAPFIMAGKSVSRFFPDGSPPEAPLHFTAGFLPPIIAAATVAAIAWMCAAFGLSLRVSASAALLCAFGAIIAPYSKMNFSENLVGLIIVLCFAGIAGARAGGGKKALVLIAASIAMLPLAKVSALVVAPILFYYAASGKNRAGSLAALAAGLAAGIAVSAFFNYSRFGSPFNTGYEQGWTASHMAAALYGLVFSSDKSFFVYSPIMLLAVAGIPSAVRAGRLHETVSAFMVFFALLMLHSSWDSWGGGHAWGPRFLVPAVPLLMIPAAYFIRDAAGCRVRKMVLIIIAAISIGFQFIATSVKFFPNYENGYVTDDINRFQDDGRLLQIGRPRFLPVRAQVSDAARNWSHTISHLKEYGGSRGDYKEMEESVLVERAPDFWAFLVAASAGGKIAAASLAMFAALVLAAAALLYKIHLFTSENHS